jgi:hypothetical protein
MLNPNEIAIYAALAGTAFEVDEFSLGHGVVLSRAAVHLPAESLVDLLPSVPEVNHSALKALVRSGPGLDLCGQLYVPAEFRPQRWLDRINTVWWITTLLRLRCTPELRVPLLSSEPFSGEPAARERAEHWPVETERRRLPFEPGAEPRIGEEGLRWVEAHWFHAGRLVVRRPPFNRAMKHLDKAFFMTGAAVALVALWESLEALLGTPDRSLPENVAAFLEPPGGARQELGERVAWLSEARLSAESGLEGPEGSLAETYGIVKRVLLKVIEEERVPTREEIEAGRFVGLN